MTNIITRLLLTTIFAISFIAGAIYISKKNYTKKTKQKIKLKYNTQDISQIIKVLSQEEKN